MGKPLQRVASDYSMDFIPENAGKPLHRLQSGYSVDFIPEVPLQAAAAARGGIVSRGTPLKVSVSQGGLEKARSRSPPKQTESGAKLLAREQKEEARDSAQLLEKKKKIKKKQVKQQQQLAELQRRRREEMSAKQEATMFVNEVVLAAMPEHLRKSALAKQLQRERLQPPRSAVDGVGGGGDVYAENEFGQQAGGAALGVFAKPRRKPKPTRLSHKTGQSRGAKKGVTQPKLKQQQRRRPASATAFRRASLPLCDWCQERSPCVTIPPEWVGGGYGRFCSWECAKVWNLKYSPITYRHTRDVMIDIEAGKLVRATAVKEGARRGESRRPWGAGNAGLTVS